MIVRTRIDSAVQLHWVLSAFDLMEDLVGKSGGASAAVFRKRLEAILEDQKGQRALREALATITHFLHQPLKRATIPVDLSLVPIEAPKPDDNSS
jgi:hypothetical protein